MAEPFSFMGMPYPAKFEARDPSRSQLACDALMLDIEYRGSGVGVDEVNIDERVRSLVNKERLTIYSLYLSVVRKIIDAECKTYIRPPIRYFLIDGEEPSEEVLERIEEIYKEMDFDMWMLQYERQAAYEGTVLVRPTYNQFTGKMELVKECPSYRGLDVEVDMMRPSIAAKVIYKYQTKTPEGKVASVEVVWDEENAVTTIKVKQQEPQVITEPHGHDRLPWAVLRLTPDSKRFWGPVDGGLLSFCKVRSLLASHSVMTTQTSLFEFLVLGGFSHVEATSIAQKIVSGCRQINYENQLDDEGKPLPKEISYVGPSQTEPAVVFELLQNIYRTMLSMRGHALKNFEGNSAQVQTAESLQNSQSGLLDLVRSRRPILSSFEQELWELIWVEANKEEGAVQIPPGIELTIDFAPDETNVFASIPEKIAYYEFMLANNLITAAEIGRRENPDLSVEAAQERIDENKKINDAAKPQAKGETPEDETPPNETPTPPPGPPKPPRDTSSEEAY